MSYTSTISVTIRLLLLLLMMMMMMTALQCTQCKAERPQLI